MTKIKELIDSNDTILVFDMDGVLAKLEFGEYNHYEMNDEKWQQAYANGESFYTEDKVIKRMQKYLSTKDMNNIYVLSKAYNDNENKDKIHFLTKYYKIKNENIFFVPENKDKVNVLNKIKGLHPEVEDYKIAMVEDTVEILDDIMAKTKFSTIHISSFLD
ncbi:MAG: hypothetical protein II625_04965 [Bacilli bacterium]|nr:hypothetical protein [Bacilli bacterium]